MASAEKQEQKITAHPTLKPEIPFQTTLPAREPILAPIPDFLSEKMQNRLREHTIHALYRHQASALEEIFNCNHIILSTGTASGKSLCYQIPIVEMLEQDPNSTALLIFPTKALTQDQHQSLTHFAPEYRRDIAIFDGDTPQHQRAPIRKHVRVIFTNPDMLHMGMLPYHSNWMRFFENLKIIVIDEAHVYRGIFGSHTANVIRRLSRVTQRYSGIKRPCQFILCTATLSNAQQLAEKLIQSTVTEIKQDDSGCGIRQIQWVNPPIINEELHVRAGNIHAASKIAAELAHKNHQILLFTQSRQSVESAIRHLRDNKIEANGYRSGYLPHERRKIEAGLKTGALRCVAATNALELGMDIGGMDTVLSVGYPGSIASFYQRMGRAGRNRQPSQFYFVASQNPTDQYLMKHPEFLLNHATEPALIDPDNVLILFQHLQCALFEIPFSENESFGGLSVQETQTILEYFVQENIARKSNGHFYWIQSDTPQRTVSLRNSGLDRIAIQSETWDGKHVPIGEIDRSSAYWMVHEGAIYFHNGETYKILALNLADNVAIARPMKETDYTTEAIQNTAITVNQRFEQIQLDNGTLHTAAITVTNRVMGYKKRLIANRQILEICELDLPEETIETKAFIIQLSSAFRDALQNISQWKNEPNQYGKGWDEIRKRVITRDQHRCQLCGMMGDDQAFHVHHIIPFRNFSNPQDANTESNLTTLCPVCHQRVETTVRMKSGLSGIATAFHQIAALFLECDTNDIHIHLEPNSTEFEGCPVIFFYETIPNGIGLSQTMMENYPAIIQAVHDLIADCDCEDGCPGCVGAAGEIGIGGKQESLAICDGIMII